ncbi:PIG-L deacetylase family protein [Fictibacillus phosphorivorans]|uniref:PIG-L deacetylase family protein n=1 Tax=Fictibacillus phosphorivorans TaxID=1221500 RepID=UPI003CEDBD63
MLKRKALKIARPFITPLNAYFLKKYYKNNMELTPIESMKKILVLAPHVDDETIGLGGTILNAVSNGTEVHCIYITDGSKSVSGLSKEGLMAARKQEADKVQQILGIHTIEYFDQPDGQVTVNQQVVKKLANYIEKFDPDIIFTTTFIDCHPDHVATARILANSLEEINFNGEIWSYEINCPIDPSYINRVIDVTKQSEKKNTALSVFQSQSIDFDGFVYLSQVKRALLKNHANIKSVETFLALSPATFIQVSKRLNGEGTHFSHLFRQVNKTETLLLGVLPNRQQKHELYRKGYHFES